VTFTIVVSASTLEDSHDPLRSQTTPVIGSCTTRLPACNFCDAVSVHLLQIHVTTPCTATHLRIPRRRLRVIAIVSAVQQHTTLDDTLLCMFPRTGRWVTGLSVSLSVRTNVSPYHRTSNAWGTSCRFVYRVARCSSVAPKSGSDKKQGQDDGAGHSLHNTGPHHDQAILTGADPQPTNLFPPPAVRSVADILAIEQKKYEEHSTRLQRAARTPDEGNKVPRILDWVPLARELDQFPLYAETQNAGLATGKVVFIDRKAYAAYTNSDRPNAWTEDQGTGVHVTVPDSQEDPRPAVLRGSPFYVDRVRQKLSKLPQSYPEDHPPTGFDDTHRMEAITSVRDFEEFVHRILYPRVVRNIESSIHRDYSIYGGYNGYVAEVLSKVFTNPYTSRHASSVALNRALFFMYLRADMQPTARLLFAQGQRLGLVDIYTYNMRLKYAIKARSRGLAMSTVREMQQDGVSPDCWTWATLWTAARTTSQRHEITMIMKRRNDPMHEKVWGALLGHHLRDRLKKVKDDPDQLSAIFEELDTLFGSDWFSPVFHHVALRICLRYRLFKLASKFDEVMLERKLPIMQKARLWRLALACESRNLVEGVKTFRSWLLAGGYKQAERRKVVGLLFRLAWETNAANICRLAWRFAATHGLLTYRTLTLVRRSLLQQTYRQDDNQDAARMRSSNVTRHFLKAMISVGIDPDLTDFAIYFPRLTHLSGTVRSPVELLNQQIVTEDLSRELHFLIYVILYRDLNAWRVYKPMSPEYLNERLQIALQKDLEWRAKDDYLLETPVEIALNDACDVNVFRPETSHRYRRLYELHQEVLANLRAFANGDYATEDPGMRSLDDLLAPDSDPREWESSPPLFMDEDWELTSVGSDVAKTRSSVDSVDIWDPADGMHNEEDNDDAKET
jgi:pentatricopeptide repeat protein